MPGARKSHWLVSQKFGCGLPRWAGHAVSRRDRGAPPTAWLRLQAVRANRRRWPRKRGTPNPTPLASRLGARLCRRPAAAATRVRGREIFRWRPQAARRAEENSPALQCWVWIAGEASPGRDDRSVGKSTLLSSLAGLFAVGTSYPALKCWAILGRPCGTDAATPAANKFSPV